MQRYCTDPRPPFDRQQPAPAELACSGIPYTHRVIRQGRNGHWGPQLRQSSQSPYTASSTSSAGPAHSSECSTPGGRRFGHGLTAPVPCWPSSARGPASGLCPKGAESRRQSTLQPLSTVAPSCDGDHMNKPSRKTTAIILILASVSTAVLPAISPVQAPQLLVADFIWSLTGVRTVTFSSSTSGGTSPYFIEWTFGDGGTGQGSPVIHPYAAEGSYAVNMSVLDSANNRAFKVQTVTVTNYTPGSFAVAGDIGPVGRPNDVSRQSLLRLGNTTGLNFFLADGYLAGGFYYRNEAAWCSDFQAHLPQGTGLVIVAGETDTGWTSVPFDDIIYDTNGNGVYNVGSDTLLFNGWGGSSKLAGPSDGSPIATDSRLVYVDSNSNHHWDQGEAVVYAYDGANTAMRDYYPVMVGPISSVGSTMSSDSKIRYFQRDNNAFYVRPQSNNDYEQYVKGCGPYFPPSSVVPGGWVGSGISCSNDPTFNTFPSCYGREYYFDCCGTVPQLR
ncbi:PKD domain-containing protein, partial [Candidatus Bathyarchaeota archaeon]